MNKYIFIILAPLISLQAFTAPFAQDAKVRALAQGPKLVLGHFRELMDRIDNAIETAIGVADRHVGIEVSGYHPQAVQQVIDKLISLGYKISLKNGYLRINF